MESWFLLLSFYLRYQVKENTLVGCRNLFGAIVNLLTHELLMYAKPIALMVGSTNINGGIFYQMYLLPWLTISCFLKLGVV